MKKKIKSMFNEPCVVCGKKFGDDDRTFCYSKGEPVICHPCQTKKSVEEMTPKQRKGFLGAMKRMGRKYQKYLEKCLK